MLAFSWGVFFGGGTSHLFHLVKGFGGLSRTDLLNAVGSKLSGSPMQLEAFSSKASIATSVEHTGILFKSDAWSACAVPTRPARSAAGTADSRIVIVMYVCAVKAIRNREASRKSAETESTSPSADKSLMKCPAKAPVSLFRSPCHQRMTEQVWSVAELAT